MSTIHKNDPEYKLWKKRNDKKREKHKPRKKRKYLRKEKYYNSNNKLPFKTFHVPEVFSIIKNPEETILFLNEIIGHVEKIRKRIKGNSHNNFIRNFSINMDNTSEITGDALMYLLTIIKNTRGKKLLPINWIGNFPKNEKMKIFLQNSGYLKYMKTAKENLVKTNDHIQIQTGQGYEYRDGETIVDIRQKIIDFTCEKLNKNKVELNYLMTMLTEMITNIQDHAYDDENLFEHSWYIFVENNEDKISYTFMDNGLGIPTTIKKKIFEKIFEKIDIFDTDKEYKYIEAAISGIEKRSKTGLSERGNGLPSIYEQYTCNKIDNLVILSNRAFLKANEKRDLSNCLNGTIFYWEIRKEVNA